MSTPEELGLDTPGPNDLIRDGDDNITNNAQILADIYTQLDTRILQSPRRMARNSIPEGTDLTDFARHYENNGYWHVGPQVGATLTGWPEGISRAPAVIEVAATNTASTITITEVGESYSWVGTSLSQVWQGWRMTREPRAAQALQLTTPVSNYAVTWDAKNVRIPFRLPTAVSRFRIHIANRDDSDDITYTDADLRINKEVFIGRHRIDAGEMTGQFESAPTGTGFGPAVWLADSAERVSDWIDMPLDANTEYLFSYSFYNPDASEIAAGMGTNWWNAATGAVDQVDGVIMNKALQVPFVIWLELDVPATTPVLAWLGDSHVAARASEAAVHDSPAWAHGIAHGVLPRLYVQAGSRMTDWTTMPTSPKWTRWSGLPRPSACIIELGQNDMFDLTSAPETIVATLTTRLAALVPMVREHVADRIYYATVMPRSNATYSAAFEAARKEWNEYLRSLPHAADGCFELAATVEDPADPNELRGIYIDGTDAVHLNSAGSARLAQGVSGSVAIASALT